MLMQSIPVFPDVTSIPPVHPTPIVRQPVPPRSKQTSYKWRKKGMLQQRRRELTENDLMYIEELKMIVRKVIPDAPSTPPATGFPLNVLTFRTADVSENETVAKLQQAARQSFEVEELTVRGRRLAQENREINKLFKQFLEESFRAREKTVVNELKAQQRKRDQEEEEFQAEVRSLESRIAGTFANDTTRQAAGNETFARRELTEEERRTRAWLADEMACAGRDVLKKEWETIVKRENMTERGVHRKWLKEQQLKAERADEKQRELARLAFEEAAARQRDREWKESRDARLVEDFADQIQLQKDRIQRILEFEQIRRQNEKAELKTMINNSIHIDSGHDDARLKALKDIYKVQTGKVKRPPAAPIAVSPEIVENLCAENLRLILLAEELDSQGLDGLHELRKSVADIITNPIASAAGDAESPRVPPIGKKVQLPGSPARIPTPPPRSPGNTSDKLAALDMACRAAEAELMGTYIAQIRLSAEVVKFPFRPTF